MAPHKAFVRRPAYLETDLELTPTGHRPHNKLADQAPLKSPRGVQE
jgi:hypothetical protein